MWTLRNLAPGAALLMLGLACSDKGTATNDPTGFAGGAAGAAGSATGGSPVGGAGGLGGSGGSGWAGADTTTRYPAGQVLSPVSPSVAARMRTIATAGKFAANDVVMKVGASGTVSTNFMYCFAGDAQSQYRLELEGYSELLPGIEAFRAGDAAGSTPFDRDTLAAVVGRSASWVVGGPLQQEIDAINPRFAFVNYGTNDMGLGTTHLSALSPFYENMNELLDELESQGIVPVISGLNPRTDSATAALWVPTYDTMTRGLAEARQLPYISLYDASKNLPGAGMSGDGIHGNVYSSGGSQPCVFSAEALMFNYNIRNLLSMQMLDTARRVTLLDEVAPDQPVPHVGSGTAQDPIEVSELPFTHGGDTSLSDERTIDIYDGCSADQDESGAELVYRLELTQATALRAIVLDRAGVDIDLHLLADTPSGASCVARADRTIQGTFEAGTYYLALDTFVTSSGAEQEGEYLFLIQECEAGDPDCQ